MITTKIAQYIEIGCKMSLIIYDFIIAMSCIIIVSSPCKISKQFNGLGNNTEKTRVYRAET
jgi:hypothetical protein